MTTSDHALDESAFGVPPPKRRSAAGTPQASLPRRAPGQSKRLPATTAIYAKRHVVFDDDQPAEAIFQVVSGAVILTRPEPAGQRRVLEFVGPGSFLGLVSGSSYGCRAETMARTVLRRITRETVETSPALQRLIGRALTRKLERLHEETSMRSRMSATESLAVLILSLPKAEGAPPGAEEVEADYRLALPQSDMASYLGLAIETICRAMKRLKRLGAIRTSGRDWIAITDESQLARLAGPYRLA